MNYLIKTAAAAFICLTLFACSKGNDRASNIDPRTGKHPDGWAVANTGGSHTTSFLSVPTSCYQCHGKDLHGGISNVSCFSAARSGINCHANGPSGHPAGWALPAQHGAHAKALQAGMNGFAHCQLCHGADFNGGVSNKSCLNTAGCHGAGKLSPHSPFPWLDIAKTGAARTHASTDPSNAAACAVCHAGGANSNRKPSPAAPAGTAPDCFNNTLCHGVEGHANLWEVPTAHGVAAKAVSGGVTVNSIVSPVSSFASCTGCHGTNYAGGTSQVSCLSNNPNNAICHGANVNSPHPAKPWRTTGGVTHTTTDTENAGQCAVCHTAGANSTRKPVAGSPAGLTGCFDNSLCHGSEGHAPGWKNFSSHGKAAKKAPAASTGFISCQQCHGSTLNNGTAPSCMNNLLCHGFTVSAPHPAKPWTSTVANTPTHTTTDPLNVGICAACHQNRANSVLGQFSTPTSGSAGCFNNTLCHFHQLPFAPPGIAPSVHGGLAKQDLLVCKGCHGSGSNSFSGGATPTACASCHTAAKAHPTDWQGSGTYSHRTASNTANACAICHNVTTTSGGPLAGAPSCLSATFTNGLGVNTGCHPSGPGVRPHAAVYYNHNATARTNSTQCLGCHQLAQNATTPPGCLNCHFSSPVATPTGCTTCHAQPPSGSTYPNIAATHSAHVTASKVATMALACADCHTGLGSGTLDHYNRAKLRAASVQANPVAFSNSAIVAGTGTAPTYSGGATGTCANTYCHGAKMPGGDVGGTARTPTWGATLLPANLAAASCTPCHGFPPSGHGLTAQTTFPVGSNCSCHSTISSTGTTYATIFGSNKAQHINGSVEATGGSCISCHASIQTGTHGTPRDAITTEFGLAWGHKKSGRGAVTDADCIVCHLEGDFTTQTTSSKHKDGNIDLRDPDGVGEAAITNITGGTFTFTKFATSYAAGSRTATGHTANTTDNVLTQKFCLACHDSNGATNTTARTKNGSGTVTGTAAMPFGGVALGAAYTAANNAIGVQGLIDVKTQTLTTNASAHPIQGPRNRAYPAPGNTWFNVPYNNFTRTAGTKADGVVLNCFDCHNTPTPQTTRTIVAHGNAITLRGNIWANPASLCTACHIPNPGALSGRHGVGSAFNSATNNGMTTYIQTQCHYCHSSNTATPGRPIRAQDVHGFDRFAGSGTDSTWPIGATNTYKPYAFMRNTVNWTTTSWKPLSGTNVPAGTATCGGNSTSSNGCTGENMGAYTPGGTY